MVHADQTMNPVPPVNASWRQLAPEKFGGEMWDVVESAQRAERLWIGQDSGHVRGVLSYRYNSFIEDFHKSPEVERVIRDQDLRYPTFLARNSSPSSPKIGGYPAGVFPYCIVVDAQGQVAAHGSLSELVQKFGIDRLTSARKDAIKKP
jgi:hypothetical protein